MWIGFSEGVQSTRGDCVTLMCIVVTGVKVRLYLLEGCERSRKLPSAIVYAETNK